jgi:hypothetical protein
MRPEPPEPSKLQNRLALQPPLIGAISTLVGVGQCTALQGGELLSSSSGVARILDVLTMAR